MKLPVLVYGWRSWRQRHGSRDWNTSVHSMGGGEGTNGEERGTENKSEGLPPKL